MYMVARLTLLWCFQILYKNPLAAVVQVILVIALLIVNQLFLPMTSKIILVICLFSIIIYVGARYIFSGIEYTDVSTKSEYKQQLKKLRVQSIGFVAIFIVLTVVFEVAGITSFFDGSVETMEFFVVLAISGVFLFGTQYVSLRKSFAKNRELM